MKQGGHRYNKEHAAKAGEDIDVGNIVQVHLSDVDTTKVDGKNLTLVVVEKVEPRNGHCPWPCTV